MRYLVGTVCLGVLTVASACAISRDDVSSQEGAFHEVAITCDNASLRSFNEVKDSVYNPGGTFNNQVFAQGKLPKRGKPAMTAVNALTGGFDNDGSQILQCARDYRANPKGADKIIHSPGICASATWEIDASAAGANRSAKGSHVPYTGLFAPRARLNAIVRLSSGTNVVGPNAKLLMPSWGIAVKLFAAAANRTDEPARTAQIVMFADNGVAGESSNEMLRSDDPAKPHFFSNWLFGDDVFAVTSINIFNRFVTPHEQLGQPLKREARLQALDGVARLSVDGTDVPIERAHYPSIMKIQLADGVPTLADVAGRASPGVDLTADFRDQLLNYADGEISFDLIADNDAQGPAALHAAGTDHRIGKLTVDHMVVSDVCDKYLSFQHRRQGQVFSGWRPGDGGE